MARDGGSDQEKIGTREYGPSAAERQQLIAAGRAFVTCHNAALIGLDELAAVGIGLDFDIIGIIEDILADLRLITSRRASTADLREAEPPVPEWVREATITWRAERDGRGWWRAA